MLQYLNIQKYFRKKYTHFKLPKVLIINFYPYTYSNHSSKQMAHKLIPCIQNIIIFATAYCHKER